MHYLIIIILIIFAFMFYWKPILFIVGGIFLIWFMLKKINKSRKANKEAIKTFDSNYMINKCNIQLSNNCFENFISLDIETTGLSPYIDKIIEIGAVKIENGYIMETFETLINPETQIPPHITEINGITNDMVINSPTIKLVLPQLIDFVGNYSIVAHNAAFDMRFIKNACNNDESLINNKVIDTLQLSRRYFPDFNNYKLNTLINNLKIQTLTNHRALTDARATAELYIKCLKAQSEVVKSSDTTSNYQVSTQNINITANKLNAFNTVKKILEENGESLANIDYINTKSYLSITYCGYWFMRVKVDGKKFFITINIPKDEVKNIIKPFEFEIIDGKSYGITRININDINDINHHLKNIVTESYKRQYEHYESIKEYLK